MNTRPKRTGQDWTRKKTEPARILRYCGVPNQRARPRAVPNEDRDGNTAYSREPTGQDRTRHRTGADQRGLDWARPDWHPRGQTGKPARERHRQEQEAQERHEHGNGTQVVDSTDRELGSDPTGDNRRHRTGADWTPDRKRPNLTGYRVPCGYRTGEPARTEPNRTEQVQVPWGAGPRPAPRTVTETGACPYEEQEALRPTASREIRPDRRQYRTQGQSGPDTEPEKTERQSGGDRSEPDRTEPNRTGLATRHRIPDWEARPRAVPNGDETGAWPGSRWTRLDKTRQDTGLEPTGEVRPGHNYFTGSMNHNRRQITYEPEQPFAGTGPDRTGVDTTGQDRTGTGPKGDTVTREGPSAQPLRD